MLKIRKYIFETNSSSSDYYRDDNHGEPLPSSTWTNANIHIELHWKEGVSEERKKAFFNLLDDTICDKIAKEIEDNHDSFEELEVTNFNNYDTIILNGTVYLDCENWSQGYAGDRYCPPEGPSCEYAFSKDAIVDDYDKTYHDIPISELLYILRPIARESDPELKELLPKLYADGKVDYEDIDCYDYDEEIPGYIDEIGDTFDVYVGIDYDKAYDNIW